MSSIKRISLSIPIDLANDLDYVHRRVGVSKSALVSELLAGGLRDVRELLESLPEQPTPDDLVRLRGASADLVASRVGHYQSQLED